MADIEFYEKPECINGEKQKAILRKAGHNLRCINILKHPWTKEALHDFVVGKRTIEMMNPSAPAIKSGDVVPTDISFPEALEMMLDDPILIKRPLIRIEGMAIQGFNDKRLKPYIGDWDGKEDVVNCPNLNTISCDEKRGETDDL